ncbi:hypothetical protein NGR_c16270 [Sinorhizobium fredii NGR234]|uniref:Uncharacterized protein n=1 Tax=Sinorhizobium fredii (strain NBRC 101917 / NGR234) TaxID=394 RepID=C3MD73_SINFN|nr:hypothetical protein NGR_c16270 [Sinorhizobium fredii NGR234]
MKNAAHISFESVVDHLVLLHAGLATKRFGHDFGGIVVAVTGQIADRDLGTGNSGLDHVFDVAWCHGHDMRTPLLFFCGDRNAATAREIKGTTIQGRKANGDLPLSRPVYRQLSGARSPPI